ncbi:MAG: hypothetical protein GWN01_10870 [Nitrosopumilaceae archaeon]|nr:hypothetical protein [Nitrosopumilaceae archaeon]NIU01388.1 hypothetical protein [Nitrosopumilaceae archaeon]NIU87746.1 hypothetical protein [Nitrosopumilaceae archaeon]NIV66123.1 hypothetical protein [Nitrosopumilaceae archaeon]NIX61990.1 hypothetical protein [Nitrosopumilaceae archaeon]
MPRKFGKIKDLSSIGIADIVGSGISALFWFYLATLIEPDIYGEINYFISIANVGATVSLLGATQSLLVYSSKGIKIHSSLYILNLIVGVVSALIVTFMVNDASVGLLVVGYLVFAISYSDVLGRKYFKTYTKYILIQKLLMFTLSIGFFFLFGTESIILGMALSFFIGVFQIFYGFKETKIDFGLLRKKFNFISFNYALSITRIIRGTIDKLIIPHLFGFAILGNYSLGLQFFTMMMILPMIVGKYLIPLESSGVENKKLKKLIIVTSIVIGILGVLIGPEIGSILFPKFAEADSVIRIVSLGVIPATVSLTYSAKFLGREQGKIILVLGIIKTTIMILSVVFLGTLYGIEGIATGIVLSSTGEAIISIILAKITHSKKN